LLERIYTDLKDLNTQLLPEFRTDYLLGKIKNGTNVEVRHSLLDSAIVSEALERQIKEETQKEVRYWDISKVKITRLYTTGSVLKAFRKTTRLKNIREEYINEKKGNEKTLTDVVKNVLTYVTLLLFITTLISYVYGFLSIETTGISVGTTVVPLQAAILLIAFITLFFMWCGFICKKRYEKNTYFIDKINELLGDLSKDDVDKILKSLKPQKCNLNKHCINLIVNTYNLPDIILQILRSFVSYQISKQGYSRSKNLANIVFSLDDTESPFFQCDDIEKNLTTLRLERLTYIEKLEYLDEENKKNTIREYEGVKVLLKHLGIDIIKHAAKDINIKQISEDLLVCKEFKKHINSMLKNSKNIIKEDKQKRKGIIIILLYFYTWEPLKTLAKTVKI